MTQRESVDREEMERIEQACTRLSAAYARAGETWLFRSRRLHLAFRDSDAF